ncbi:hypothetical protein FRC02_010901 [Tulasnella sp. 418]|nr:hypothetical protein FRC02_010901 [Tulasnella sp. 418]
MDIAIPSCSLQSVLTQPCQLRCESEDFTSETDITLAFRRSFPLEIILHILNFLGDKISLTSAARVSSFFQVECERILYRDVRLLSWFAVERFLDAMVKRIWRLKAVRLLIVNPGDGWTNHQLVGTLSNSLSIMTNLQKLKLKRSFTFLKLEDLRLPSSLQSLCLYPELSTHKMAKLLHELTSLQFLDYIWDDEVPAFACSMDFLPKLTGIKSNLTSLVHIVQNRPVRRVSIAGAVEKNEWERLFMALNQSSSYIEDFNGYFLANSVDEILAAITKELPQLETLKIGVVIEDIVSLADVSSDYT